MRRKQMPLPEFVELCPVCKGEKGYNQTYTAGCGMGAYVAWGKCSLCKGAGYTYKGSSQPVPESVVAQIEHQARG